MIQSIRYTIDSKTYTLKMMEDGSYQKELTAPDAPGQYDSMIEITEAGGRKTYIDNSDPRFNMYLNVLSENIKQVNLLKYLIPELRDIFDIRTILEIESRMLDDLYDTTALLKADMFIETASVDMISRLEKFFGVRAEGSIDERKRYLLAMERKGQKTDENTLRRVVDSMTGGRCTIKFFAADEPDNPHPGYGLLQIRHTGQASENLKRLINQLLPAHIELEATLYMPTWKDIRDNFKTWADVRNTFSSWLEVKEYIPPELGG